jgi:hypothetical protein
MEELTRGSAIDHLGLGKESFGHLDGSRDCRQDRRRHVQDARFDLRDRCLRQTSGFREVTLIKPDMPNATATER